MSKEKSPEEFNDKPSVDPNDGYWEYLETMYGHGWVSSDSDGVDFSDDIQIQHLVDKISSEQNDDIPEGMTEEDAAQLEEAYNEYAREWAKEKIQSIHNEKYNENSTYVSTVPEDIKRAFDASVSILGKIARKNRGRIEFNDSYNPTRNAAHVSLTGKGFHFENDRAFRAILRFFSTFSVDCQKDNGVSLLFERINYYDTKEL